MIVSPNEYIKDRRCGTMSVWNKVLLVLILLTGVVHLQLASQRYMLAKEWEGKISKLEKQLSDMESSVVKIKAEVYGDRFDVEQKWEKMCPAAKLARIKSVLPGAFWANCAVNEQSLKVNGESVSASFILAPQYEVTGVRPNGIVYVFDSGSPAVTMNTGTGAEGESAPADDQKKSPPYKETYHSASAFLGIFRISGLNKTEISLSSVTTCTEEDITKITQSIKSKNSWIVCADRLPIDSPDYIVDWLNESTQFLGIIPIEMQSYLNRTSFVSSDMTKFKAEELDTIASSKNRFAVDYNYILEKGFTKRDLLSSIIKRKQLALADINVVLVNQLVMMGIDITPETDALVDKVLYTKAKTANKPEDLVAKKNRITKELSTAEHERDFVKTKLDSATSTLASIRAEADRLLNDNCDLAVKIAKAQFMAARRITQAAGKAGKFSIENKKDIL